MTSKTIILKLIAVSSLVVTSTLARAEIPSVEIERFLVGARGVVAELNLAAPAAETVVTTITSILEDAKPVVIAYGEKHTQCAVQLARLLELYPELDVWTAQEIRRNIEAGASLPPAEGCYPARDIVAHPAIVRSLSRSGIPATLRARLIREMNEAIEHMENIAEDLAQE